MIKNISNPPSQSYYKKHYFCDYIEMLALINNQDIISISDVYDRFKKSSDTNSLKKDNNSDTNILEENTQNINDKWTNRIQEWFDDMATRAIVFKDFYPFILECNSIQLKNDLTKYHKAYILLLLSSSQKYIKKATTLANDFEKLSLVALKNYLPKTAESYIFGKQSDRYKGTLKDKTEKLAQDLKCSSNSDSNSNNTGDGGLDLVSWIPFLDDDNFTNIQIFLAQCATGEKWSSKQCETERIVNVLTLKAQINHMFFMPYDCRNGNNRVFSEKDEITIKLFFDRIRIIYLLMENVEEVMGFESMDGVVNRAISFKEDIV